MGIIFNPENEIAGFGENLTVALWYDTQQRVMLPEHPKIEFTDSTSSLYFSMVAYGKITYAY